MVVNVLPSDPRPLHLGVDRDGPIDAMLCHVEIDGDRLCYIEDAILRNDGVHIIRRNVELVARVGACLLRGKAKKKKTAKKQRSTRLKAFIDVHLR